MKFLITGGAGYIGSHVIKEIALRFDTRAEILVLDNLSTGHREAVLFGQLVEGDIRDTELVRKIMESFVPDVVMHFSALIVAPESVRKPVEYWDNNVGGTISLLRAIGDFVRKTGRKVAFIFSSSAAVYGSPKIIPVPETAPTLPENPYGETKLACEKLLSEFAEAERNFKVVSLRYFNAAGADPDGQIGHSPPKPTHLITRALRVAKGEIPFLEIYGTDYPTRDGTCIRDYIHVTDLARAHVLAVEYLLDGGESDVFNVGYGRGYSVFEVVRTVEKVIGREIPKKLAPRREGDPVSLVADVSKIKRKLGFSPRFDDLEFIVRTAWRWELERRY